jgi:mRNA interferase RelE/StbE
MGSRVLIKGIRYYWRFRIGDYRAICEVKDELVTVIVIAIGHRREIYR